MNDNAANPTPAPEPPPPSGDYGCQVLRSIGRGAYGQVWLARDPAGEYRALKIISRDSFDHDRPFEREFEGIVKFEAVSRSDHNQIQIYSVNRREQPREFYYLMELADDQNAGPDIRPETYVPKTLRSELKRRGRLPASECIKLGLALARTVGTLHAADLIHRDIKPANIIFVQNQPTLADIGLVTDASLSVSHVGTEGFIPPEGPGAVASDLYSLGKVLYEMCTGLDRMDFPELPADFPEFPDRVAVLELNAVIARACERDPRRRYRTAAAMADDLELLRRGGSVRRRRGVRRRAAAAAVVGVIVSVGGLVFLAGVQVWHRLFTKPAIAPGQRHLALPDDPRNLIVNGSFERPVMPLPDNKLGLFVLDATNLLPWQTTAGTFEVWSDDIDTPGRRFIARSAAGLQNLEILSTTNRATVWQTVRTVPGKEYTLSFFHTPRPGVVSTMTVSVNSNFIGEFHEDGTSLNHFRWRRFTTNFLASSNLSTVSFADRAQFPTGTHLDGVILMPTSVYQSLTKQ